MCFKLKPTSIFQHVWHTQGWCIHPQIVIASIKSTQVRGHDQYISIMLKYVSNRNLAQRYRGKMWKKNYFYLIYVAQVSVKVWIFNQFPFGALEQNIVHTIKPYQSGEQTHICKCYGITTQISWAPQMFIHHVQSTKQLVYRGVVSFLTLSKSAPIVHTNHITQFKACNEIA